MQKLFTKSSMASIICLAGLVACGDGKDNAPGKEDSRYPIDAEHRLRESRGSLTGEGGLFSLGGDSKKSEQSPIGVNSFLWRASLDTLSFMPLLSADPFGGVILTDWYEDSKTPGERFKVTVLILDKTLRADGIKVTLFKQIRQKRGEWRDVASSASVARDLENTILTRARELKAAQKQ